MTQCIASAYSTRDLAIQVTKATAMVLRYPIETPVQTSFGTMHDRPALYLMLEDALGYVGIGEVWCNFPTCGAEHRHALLETVLFPALLGNRFDSPEQGFQALQAQSQRLAIQSGEPGPIAQCIAGIDIALWDLVAKRLELPLHRLLGSQSTSIGVYASGINPSGAIDSVERCRAAGYSAFKLKIGFGDEVDYPNIESISAGLQFEEILMVDANQAWTLAEAIVQAQRLEQFPLAWLEEPIVASSANSQWQELGTASGLPLAAGENLLDAQSFAQANASGWLSVMQPDLCKWGGFSGVLPVARETLAQGKRYCPHFLGGGVGLLASAHLLAAVGGDGLLEIDANPNPLREALYAPHIENGRTSLGNEPGLGIDPSALETLRSNPELSVHS